MIRDNKIYAFKRSNNLVGVRNIVAVISVMDCVNPIVRSIANQVDGAIAIPTIAGRGQFGKDSQINQKTIIGIGKNPNVTSVLLVSLEPVSANLIAKKIRTSGKVVETVTVQEVGSTIDTVCIGTKKLVELIVRASEEKREEVDLKKLTIGVECGGSDTTSGLITNPIIGSISDRLIDLGGKIILSETSEFIGAEHILAKRAKTKGIANKIIDAVQSIEDDAKRRGVDIRGANPVADNIKGGITTIEEKSLGAIMKGGTKKIQSFLEYSEKAEIAGLNIMDTPAPAVESMTGLVAGGVNLILFSTGVGNSIGHMVAPTVKITSNPNTAKTFADNIDIDLSEYLKEDLKIRMNEIIDEVWKEILSYASGKKTRAEILKQTENAPSKIERTV